MQKLQPFQSNEIPVGLDAEIQISDGKVTLHFEWTDGAHLVHVPNHLKLERHRELWKSTCFEAFLQAEHSHDYYEINFSPGGAWDAYHFHHYRTPHPPEQTSEISLLSFHREHHLAEAVFALKAKSHIWRCALTAVVELKDGHKIYFASEHCGERPDFHLNESFKLRRVES